MIVQLEDINKSFSDDIILENVSLRISKTGKYSLIGSNGAGKTTLLNIINGNLRPDSGNVILSKNTHIGFLKQENILNLNMTIYEEAIAVFNYFFEIQEEMKNILISLEITANTESENTKLSDTYTKLQNYFEINGGYNIDAKIDTILNGMGFTKERYDDPISILSGGEKTRLAMAKLLLEEPNLLILDEPTNHLDFKTLLWLENYLLEYKHAILVVSHDRYFLDKITNNTIELKNHKVKSYKGNYSKFLLLKKEYQEKYEKEYAAQKEEIAKLEEFIRKNIARASTSNMAKSRRKTLEKMEKLPPPEKDIKSIKLRFHVDGKPFNDILSVKDLEIAVGEMNDVILSKNLSIEVKRGDKIALIGENGVGKTTFIKTIQGLNKHEKGSVVWGERVKVGYFEQETLDLNPKNTVISEVWDRFPHKTELEIRNILGSVRLSGDDIYKSIRILSGGEKAKVKFCILSLQPNNVLIMDEPTNHLDLDSKSILEDALDEYEGTLIFISHDRYLLNKVPDKIIEITSTGIDVFLGKYDEYMKSKEKNSSFDSDVYEKNTKPQSNEMQKKSFTKTKEQRREEANKRSEVSKLEKDISFLEIEIDVYENDLTKEIVFTDYIKMKEITDALEKNKILLEKYYVHWEELMK